MSRVQVLLRPIDWFIFMKPSCFVWNRRCSGLALLAWLVLLLGASALARLSRSLVLTPHTVYPAFLPRLWYSIVVFDLNFAPGSGLFG